jgi:hypothetical protein
MYIGLGLAYLFKLVRLENTTLSVSYVEGPRVSCWSPITDLVVCRGARGLYLII